MTSLKMYMCCLQLCYISKMGNMTDVDVVEVKRVERIANKYYNDQRKQLSLVNLKKEWKVILNLRDWTNLHVLKLRACGVDNSDMKLLTSQRFPYLKTLDLDLNFLSIKGLAGLTHAQFPTLQQLSLNENYLKNQGISQVLISNQIKQLKCLYVGYNNISAIGIANIKKILAPKILHLQFNRNDIGSYGCKLLAKSNLPTLEKLYLKQCQIGNEGIKHLIKAKWPNLNILNISCNQINGEGIDILTTSSFKRLNKIFIDRIDPITFLSFIERVDLLCALSEFLINGNDSFTNLLQKTVTNQFS